MAVTEGKIVVGTGPDAVETTTVTTGAGAGLHREGVTLSDPEVAAARTKVTASAPSGTDYGAVVWVQGGVAITGSVTIGTLPAITFAAPQHVIVDSGTLAATQSGAWNIGTLTSITNPVAVTGPLTDAQLRAVAVPVSGTISTKTDLAPAAPTSATVGVASGAAVAANASRKGLHVRNTSTSGQRISLSLNGAAVLDSGFTLYPQDLFEMDEYDFDVGALNAIASAASARLSVQEFS